MKKIATIAAVAALTTLAACGEAEVPAEAVATEEAAVEATPAATEEAAALEEAAPAVDAAAPAAQ